MSEDTKARFSKSWIWCLLVNLATIAVLLSARGMTIEKNDRLLELLEFALDIVQIVFFAHYSLFLLCAVPASVFNWVGAALLWVVLLGATPCFSFDEEHALQTYVSGFRWIMPHQFLLALMAALPLRIAGIELTSTDRTHTTRQWQYSLGSITSAMIVLSIYLAIIMNLLKNGLLVFLFNLDFPEIHLDNGPGGSIAPAPDGAIYVAVLAAEFVAVLVLALFLRCRWICAWAAGIGASIILFYSYCMMSGDELSSWHRIAMAIGIMLASPAIIALPWSMAGFRTRLGQPLFESKQD